MGSSKNSREMFMLSKKESAAFRNKIINALRALQEKSNKPGITLKKIARHMGFDHVHKRILEKWIHMDQERMAKMGMVVRKSSRKSSVTSRSTLRSKHVRQDWQVHKDRQASEDWKVRKDRQASRDWRVRKDRQASKDWRVSKDRQASKDWRVRKDRQASEDWRVRKYRQASKDWRVRQDRQASKDWRVRKDSQVHIDWQLRQDIEDSKYIIKNFFEKYKVVCMGKCTCAECMRKHIALAMALSHDPEVSQLPRPIVPKPRPRPRKREPNEMARRDSFSVSRSDVLETRSSRPLKRQPRSRERKGGHKRHQKKRAMNDDSSASPSEVRPCAHKRRHKKRVRRDNPSASEAEVTKKRLRLLSQLNGSGRRDVSSASSTDEEPAERHMAYIANCYSQLSSEGESNVMDNSDNEDTASNSSFCNEEIEVGMGKLLRGLRW